ncbi:MAG: pilus assembly protein N-terminal domain-containing protein, partial [Pseudorhodoplanes sp.]
MNKNNECIAASARHKDRGLLRASMAAAIATAWLAFATTPVEAQRVVSIGGAKRTAMVAVSIGKTEDVRTDNSFVDLQVGDPEVADVNPLTDKSLTILGRKSGTTRVTAYGENKKMIGVFDVEVTHDTSMVASTLAKRFPNAKLKVTSVNGRIMLSGTTPDAVTLDKAV